MSQLLITLPTPDAAPGAVPAELAYALLSSAGVVSSHGQAAPALLPKADACAILVPPQALSWHGVELPKLTRGTSSAKLQAVLAGLLEEQLLDDPAELHLSLHKIGSQDWVAACHKAWLKAEIAALQAAGVNVTSIAPMSMPQDSAHLHASGAADAPELTLCDAQGVLHIPLHATALLPADMQAELTAEPAVAAAAEQATGLRFTVMQAPQRALAAWQTARAQGINLAQGEITVGGGNALQRLGSLLAGMLAAPAWRPFRWGVLALLAAQLIGLNAWAWQQKRELSAQRSQMNSLLTRSFPQVKVVVDAPVQMQRELLALRQASGQLSSRDFESILSQFSAAASESIAPSAIDYVAGDLSMKGVNLASGQLDTLATQLLRQGLALRSDAQQLLISANAEAKK